MGIIADIFGSNRKKRRSKKVVKAFALWARGDGDDPIFLEVFKTKTAARARIKRLLKNAPWRKSSDYEIRQTRIASGRIFENK